MSDIMRLAGRYTGRNRAVRHSGLVFTVGTDQSESATVAEQTRRTLEAIDQNLRDAGSDRSRILSATVYLTQIASKSEMDAEWNAWIGPDNWPQRACVQAELAGNTLVEITMIAAAKA